MHEACSSCPFRIDGIRTTPQNAQRLITLAFARDADHPCHDTVTSGQPQQCRGAALFRANALADAGQSRYFATVADFVVAQQLGVLNR